MVLRSGGVRRYLRAVFHVRLLCRTLSALRSGMVDRNHAWVRHRGAEYPPSEDETESMVCRRCRLDIGLGLRES